MLARSLLLVLAFALVFAGCSSPPERPAPAAPAAARPRPIVVLETDFGSKEDAPTLLKGVILSIARDAQIVDLTHDVPPYDIVTGAQNLEDSPGIFPAGTVFVVVVDPGVGTARKSIAVELRNGCFLVGPDNGVLSLAMEKYGVKSVREITSRDFQREHQSETFHGRDVFSPCGAHLAIGSPAFPEVGPESKEWVKLDQPAAKASRDGAVEGIVAKLDDPYGNVWTNATFESFLPAPAAFPGNSPEASKTWLSFGARLTFAFGDRKVTAPLVKTFGEVPEQQPLAYWNSRGRLSLALNMGDAARTYGVKRGDKVTITREK